MYFGKYKISQHKEYVFVHERNKNRYYIGTDIDPNELQEVLEKAGMVVEDWQTSNIELYDAHSLLERAYKAIKEKKDASI